MPRHTLLRPSLRRDICIGLLLLLLIGVATMLVAEHIFDRQTGFINLVNTASRLRMQSQRIAFIAQRVAADPGEIQATKKELNQVITGFENDLNELERLNREMDTFSGGERNSFDAGMAVIREQWRDYRQAAETVAGNPPQSPQFITALRYLDNNVQSLLVTADNNIRHIIEHSSADRVSLRLIMFAVLLTGAWFLLRSFFYLRKRLLMPFSTIARMAEHLAKGDFNARVDYAGEDEVGDLVKRLNLTAESMQDLFAKHLIAEEILRENETRSRLILETSHDAIVVTDALGIIGFANQSVCTVFGYLPDELIGKEVFSLYPERYRDIHRAGVEEFLRSGTLDNSWKSMEIWGLHKSGREIRLNLAVNPTHIQSGHFFAGFFRDLSQRDAVLADLQLLNRAMESSGEGIMISDAQATDHHTIYVNRAFERITGYSQEQVLGRNARMLLGTELKQPGAEVLRNILRSGKEGIVTLDCLHKDGRRYWCELSAAPVRDEHGKVTHFISVCKDVTERLKQAEEMLRWAHYDALTGLPNRILFQDRLQQAIAAASRHERGVGVLFIDLDGFKLINDSLGHGAGDTLLKEAAARLQLCVRDDDTVARIGGDEFLLLLNEVEGEYGINSVAERALENMTRAFAVSGQEVFVGASIGISVYPRDGEEGEILVRNADLAMYRAKANGRNSIQAYSQEMHARRERWMTLEAKLRKAVDQGDFVLHYQPQLNLANGQITGAEALIRWNDKDMGLVSPGQFIGLAEETGLIGAIGDWVLHHACWQIGAWLSEGLPAPRIAVNISARQFHHSDIFKTIEQNLHNHGLDASRLEVELTESMVMQDPDRTILILRQMREAGLNLSLDDFGTGYSSLSYLRRFPLDVLKVDQSFVREMTSNEEAAAIARAIITLAHSLNLGVVAEGVETAEQRDFLVAHRCDVMQGYLLSKPLPADEFGLFLQRNQIQASVARMPRVSEFIH